MKRVDLGFTELEIYENFVVGRTREGVEIDMDKHRQVLEAVRREIKGPFGLIVDEANSYSVRFDVMLSIKNDPDIVCGAVVAYRFATLKAMAAAAAVTRKPVRYFKTVEEAKEWVRQILA